MRHLALAVAACLLVLPGGRTVRPSVRFEDRLFVRLNATKQANLARQAPGPLTAPKQVSAYFFLFALGSCFLLCVPTVFYATHSKEEESEEGEEGDDADGGSNCRCGPIRALAWFCGVSFSVGLTLVAGVVAPAAVCAARNSPAHVLAPPGNHVVFTLDNMSVLPPPSLYARLREGVYDEWTHEASGHTFGLAGVHETPMLLYNGTKIEGNWERVPIELRGVFWLKGDGVPEILATLQGGEWFEQEQVLICPNAPFSWSWYAGVEPPSMVSEFKWGHTYHMDGKTTIADMQHSNYSFAFGFRPCPKGAVCEEGSEEHTFADITPHLWGDLTHMLWTDKFATWTMEEDASVAPRYSSWKRRISWVCDKVEFGSYLLTKIIDENGERIEPHYSQYVEFLEGAPQFVWTGLGPGKHLV